MEEWIDELCNAERDRVTAAEICIDELLTIMQRRGAAGSRTFEILEAISGELHSTLTQADGPSQRRERLLRVRKALTEAMPMTDESFSDRPALSA